MIQRGIVEKAEKDEQPVEPAWDEGPSFDKTTDDRGQQQEVHHLAAKGEIVQLISRGLQRYQQRHEIDADGWPQEPQKTGGDGDAIERRG
jgi:hypothetical protein